MPQGGVLSPILFAIYTAELPNLLERCGVICKQFADDIKVYKKVEVENDVSAIQQALVALSEWSAIWRIPLASAKTVHMRIGNSSVFANYSLDGLDIISVDHVKDLGSHYDCKLSFADHYKFL